MKNNAVTNKIRLFKEIKPNPDWLESQRRNLLLHIKSDNEAQRAWSLSEFFVPKLALKPVMAGLLLLALVFGGGFLTIQAAEKSLPGDLLYAIKIAVEDIRATVSSQEGRANLQVEYIGNRAQEISKIIEGPDDINKKKENVFKTIDKLQAQAADIEIRLIEVKESKPHKVVDLAKKVSQKTTESQEVLTKAKEKIVEEFKGEESEEEMLEAIDEALAIMLATKKEAEEVKSEVEMSEIEELPEEEINEPIIPTVPVPNNEASETFENTTFENTLKK